MIYEIFVLIILFYFLNFVFRKLKPKSVVCAEGKAVLITGCDTGFGNRSAQRLNELGFKVYATVLSTNSPGAKDLKTNAKYADKMIVLQMNVTNDTKVNEVYERVKQDLENSGHKLWSVVNNAGINSSCPLEWGTLDNYYKQFEVNLFGVVRVTRVFLPLVKSSQGRIVNIVSILGRFSIKLGGIYSMNKHALVAFSDTLRREISRFNVKVISIEPAFFRTAITDSKAILRQLQQNWNQTSDEVKGWYKDWQYEGKVVQNLDKLVSMSDNTEIVIDDIIDAIVNTQPKNTYRTIDGLLNKIEMFLALYLPTDVFDKLSLNKEKSFIN